MVRVLFECLDNICHSPTADLATMHLPMEYDDVVRTAEGWRIRHRVLTTIWTEGNPVVLRGEQLP